MPPHYFLHQWNFWNQCHGPPSIMGTGNFVCHGPPSIMGPGNFVVTDHRLSWVQGTLWSRITVYHGPMELCLPRATVYHGPMEICMSRATVFPGPPSIMGPGTFVYHGPPSLTGHRLSQAPYTSPQTTGRATRSALPHHKSSIIGQHWSSLSPLKQEFIKDMEHDVGFIDHVPPSPTLHILPSGQANRQVVKGEGGLAELGYQRPKALSAPLKGGRG